MFYVITQVASREKNDSLTRRLPTYERVCEWASECAYMAVEDHEALIEVVMLHGGVAVELGQWVVTPGEEETEGE